MKKLIETAKKALATPYSVYHAIVDGFSFGIYYDTKRGWFECCMLYNPSYSGKTYIYGSTVEEFVENAKAQIADVKKIYTDGGYFPKDYYENPPYLCK